MDSASTHFYVCMSSILIFGVKIGVLVVEYYQYFVRVGFSGRKVLCYQVVVVVAYMHPMSIDAVILSIYGWGSWVGNLVDLLVLWKKNGCVVTRDCSLGVHG